MSIDLYWETNFVKTTMIQIMIREGYCIIMFKN